MSIFLFMSFVVVVWPLKYYKVISLENFNIWMGTHLDAPSEFFSTHCVLVANRSFSPHLLKSPLYFCFRPSCSLFSREMYVTMSWGPGNHSKLTPGSRPMFLKVKLHKESRNGFKTINNRCYPVMIFSKNWFLAQKIIKKLDVLLIFEFLRQYI